MRAMIYIKSIGVGLAFVLGLVCIAALLSALVLSIASRLHETYYIALHFRHFWIPCILIFVAGFIWAYRHFSK